MIQDYEDDAHALQIQCGIEIKYARMPKSPKERKALHDALLRHFGPGQLVMPNKHYPMILNYEQI